MYKSGTFAAPVLSRVAPCDRVNYLTKDVRINHRIAAPEVRLIGPDGKNVGVVSTSEALERAKAAGLDLIEISPNAHPPVAKIMDYGKYKYEEDRKTKGPKRGGGEMRTIRVGLGTSDHDLEMKAKQAAGFLEKGDRIKVDLFLRGRSKYLDRAFLRERLKRILIFIPIPHKIVEDGKWGPRGPYVLIEKA